MSRNSHFEDNGIETKPHGASCPERGDSLSSHSSRLLNDKDSRYDSHGSSDSEKHERISGNSDQTVLSYSPPLEVLVASTIEHPESDLYDTISQRGMLPPDTQLAHFVVTKYIGGGGMGRVYLGIDQALDRKVALKVLPIQRAHDGASVARFMNEAKSAARLNHEHIAQVYFAGEQNGIPFIAFEYVQGTDVRTYIKEHGVLPLPQAINYLLQISHALAHASTHQVIHRDVKPSNILITPNGRAKLIDMGLARLLTHANIDNDLTASGVTLGTFDYISPEQARDPRNVDTRSDIYSLGCTFFFMLTGRPPFSEGTVLQKLLQHQGDEPPEVRDYQPDIPPQVSQIIQKMMAKDPRSRYQSAADLVDDLTNVARMIGLRPTSTGSLIWQLPLKGRFQPILRHLPWLVPVILFVILAMLVQSGLFFSTTLKEVSPDINLQPSQRATETGPSLPPDNGNGNGSNGNGGRVNADDPDVAKRPNLGAREIRGTASPSSVTENSRITATIPSQSIGAVLEVEPASASVPTAPGLAASYQVNPSPVQTNGGTAMSFSDSQPPMLLIVDPTGQKPNSFKTLKDAASAVAGEATIELHFNGSVDIDHFRFSESTTTIRNGVGYHPKMLFQPTTSLGLTGTYSMAALNNSNMIFENVEIEMEIPRRSDAVANRWTMFDLHGENTVELRGVVLTFNNAQRERAYQEKNAFFRSCPVSSTASIRSPTTTVPPSPTAPRTKLTLTNSLIRGEASLLRCDNSRAAHVDSDNVLIAINQPVFSLLDIIPSGMSDNMITTSFRHNTIYAPFMVSWQQGTPGGKLGHPIELRLSDSIVRFHGESAAMAEYAGSIALSDVAAFYSPRISTHTFYQNFTREWVIRTSHPGGSPREEPPAEPLELQQRFFKTVVWKYYTYTDGIPVYNLRKDHFLLNENASHNNALKSDLDGRYAGIIPENIPDAY